MNRTKEISMTTVFFRRSVVLFVFLFVCRSSQLIGQEFRPEVLAKITNVIENEIAQKQLPAAYVLLVRGETVWSHAFGYSDPSNNAPASVDDVHRIASVSKLFTDIGIMQLVERGILDLDAPVSRYLPDFKPENPFEKEITLRQLMTHRAGLVREPPVGNYFDATGPTLAQTVASLNATTVVYPPETRFKYSNGGIAVAGFVLERTQHRPFAEYIGESVLKPLGMENSSFLPKPGLMKHKPKAVLWTYDGRRFDVPTFQFGMSPAANMYSTLGDLAKFMRALFNGGEGEHGGILQRRSLEAMWQPQFTPPGQKTGVGLGFFVEAKEGYRQISHSGDVYGFATEFTALPDAKLGVVVITTMNAANAWSSSMANYALDLLLAEHRGEALPEYALTKEVEPRLRRQLAGKYVHGPLSVRLSDRDGHLWLQGRTIKVVVRQHNKELMTDDKISLGLSVVPVQNGVVIGNDTLSRVNDSRPDPVRGEWEALIGEYGWDHNTLYIQERNGILHAQIEWYFSYPLTQKSPDVFDFPPFGLYHGEQLRFRRNADGFVTAVVVGAVVFPRRPLEGENGATFAISPQRSPEELRRMAASSSPPVEKGRFRKPELIELVRLDSTLHLDIRYATTDNFMRMVFYPEAQAFMQKPAAQALVRANHWLRQFGYGIVIHDAYRPWYVTKMFWEATPTEQRDFVANPAQGSRHNRGCAADVSLYRLSDGRLADMVSGYDEFSVRAYPEYPGGTSRERWNRELLRRAMEMQGFNVYVYEWWHFDYKDWQEYPILNKPFAEIR